MHGGDRIGATLEAHGVRFLFTLCGGHISPILVAAKQRGIRVVDVRHEATAVFAADAVARLGGGPGVAAVTAGPGLTNAVTAVKNAQLAHSPIVVLGGATATALKGRGALQDIDQRALMAPHVKWIGTARRVRQLVPLLDEAFAVARRGVPGPVFLECPVDLLYPEAVVREWYGAKSPGKGSFADRLVRWYLGRHVERLFAGAGTAADSRPRGTQAQEPPAGRVARAAERLRRAERPLLLVGSQALVDPAAAEQVAEAVARLGLPVYLAGMARGLLGRAHPLQRRHQRRRALREADLVLLAGVPCDFRLDYGRQIARGAWLISANLDRGELRRNRRPNLALRGDAGAFLRRLAEAGGWDSTHWRPWLERLHGRDREREEEIARMADEPGDGVHPLRLCTAIERAMDDDSVVVADGGDFVATASYVVRPRGPLSWLDPGAFGTLGVGAGFALGAKLCRPAAEVWVLYGDGSVGYSLPEFDTFVRHRLPVIAVVGNDACWSQIAREQVEILKDDVGCALRRTDYERAVEGLGGAGLALGDAARVEQVLEAAKRTAAAGAPVLINAQIARTEFRKGSISI